MKGCIKFWELVLLLWKVTGCMTTDGTMTLTSYISQNQNQYSTSASGQNQYSTRGNVPQTGNGEPYSTGQTPGNEQRTCGSYMEGSTNGATDYNVNGGTQSQMLLYGLEIMDPDMMKYLQTNYLGRHRKYDDFTWNDGYSCPRDCCRYKRPRICYYQFTLEQYSAMGPACGDCKNGNHTDCMKDQCITCDGNERTVQSISRIIPGPLVWGCEGDTIVCDVSNVSPSSGLTIHWHGVLQKGTNYMDGVPNLTQCTIGSGAVFRYIFKAGQAGTHFWHSHSGIMQGNGVFGGFVINKCDDPHRHLYKHNKPSHTIVINDWDRLLSDNWYPGYYGDLSEVMSQPTSYLINGRGNYKDEKTQTNTPLYEIHVKSDGEGYRIRFIAASVHVCLFKVAIEEHTMKLIATDGHPCKPKDFSTIVMGGGERMDVVVTTKKINLLKCRYSIIVKGMQDCEQAYMQKGWLVYDNCPEVPELPPTLEKILDFPPCFEDVDVGCDKEEVHCSHEMESMEPAPAELQCDAPADYTYSMYMGFYVRPYEEAFESKTVPYPMYQLPGGPSGVYVDTVNKKGCVMPTFPFLTQNDPYDKRMICPETCEKDFCMCVNMKHIKKNSIVRMHMHDNMGLSGIKEVHPMHIHGHTWKVCYMGSMQERQDEPDTYLLKHTNSTYPLTRDMVKIPNGGWATVLFKADNPGYWMMHCHFEDHAVTGMSMIFEVGDRCEMSLPGPGFPKCGIYLPKIKNLTAYERPPDCTNSDYVDDGHPR